MENRVAILGIVVTNREASDDVNQLLHEYSSYVIGRMGLPYEKRQMNIITIVLDAPGDVINALSGKLGRLSDVQVKSMLTQ